MPKKVDLSAPAPRDAQQLAPVRFDLRRDLAPRPPAPLPIRRRARGVCGGRCAAPTSRRAATFRSSSASPCPSWRARTRRCSSRTFRASKPRRGRRRSARCAPRQPRRSVSQGRSGWRARWWRARPAADHPSLVGPEARGPVPTAHRALPPWLPPPHVQFTHGPLCASRPQHFKLPTATAAFHGSTTCCHLLLRPGAQDAQGGAGEPGGEGEGEGGDAHAGDRSRPEREELARPEATAGTLSRCSRLPCSCLCCYCRLGRLVPCHPPTSRMPEPLTAASAPRAVAKASSDPRFAGRPPACPLAPAARRARRGRGPAAAREAPRAAPEPHRRRLRAAVGRRRRASRHSAAPQAARAARSAARAAAGPSVTIQFLVFSASTPRV